MRFDRTLLTSNAGQMVLLGGLLLAGGLAFRLEHRNAVPAMPRPTLTTPASMPETFLRRMTRFPRVKEVGMEKRTIATVNPVQPAVDRIPPALPLTLLSMPAGNRTASAPGAPYGRLIPCETVTALESNRLETPVIGLVTEDVWHDGRRVIPAGAEVHGRAALDRTRERLAVEGTWRIVWRTPDRENGMELRVEGIALDRDYEDGRWGDEDGSAGLRGEVIRTRDDRELRLFAATFLATATSALQSTTGVVGALGEAALPAATARNATLAGSGAVLREYAQQIRDAIARDGFYLRVPAGKPFYLYVTQTLNRSGSAVPTQKAAIPANP